MKRIGTRRMVAAATVGIVAAAGMALATASASNSGVTCTGAAPDAQGRVTLNCVIPMPPPATVTTPVPTTVTHTVTRTVTAPPGPKPGGVPPGTSRPPSTPPTTPPTQPSASPTQPSAPPTQPSAPPTNNPRPAGFPTAATTGVPAGWQPRETRTSWRITAPGVYEDVRVIGDIVIAADNVTLRRIEVIGGQITLWRGDGCYNGLVVEDSSFLPAANGSGGATDGVIVPGNYTVRRVKIQDRIEGLRSGACGPVVAEDTYIHIRIPAGSSAHSDGIQGYNGRGLIVRNVAIDFRDAAKGTAPLFYPRGQGNTAPVEINGLWLAGGSYPLRLGVGPATVTGVQILDQAWAFGPVDVYCPAVTTWDVSIVDAAGRVLRAVPCTGSGL